jgi:hypothetical protein
MVHPDTELRFVGAPIGFGVVATRLIPRGTITWVRDRFDQSFSVAHATALPQAFSLRASDERSASAAARSKTPRIAACDAGVSVAPSGDRLSA